MSLKFSFFYYCLLSLLFNCISIDQVLNLLLLACIIQVFAFEYDYCFKTQLIDLMKQEPYLMLTQVTWEVESQSILKITNNWFSCVWLELLTNHDRIKSNRGKHKRFVYMWLESQVTHDSNHTSFVSHFPIWFESPHTYDSIPTIFIFSFLALFKLIQIIVKTWLESQGNGSLLFCWSCYTLVVHFTQINKYSWLDSSNHFHIFWCLISNTQILLSSHIFNN